MAKPLPGQKPFEAAAPAASGTGSGSAVNPPAIFGDQPVLGLVPELKTGVGALETNAVANTTLNEARAPSLSASHGPQMGRPAALRPLDIQDFYQTLADYPGLRGYQV